MELTPAVQCTDRREWRGWLQEHHADRLEVWLVYFKKHTGKPTVTYRESVEEALCFGWIDGIKKRVDDERYAHRFTPRKPKSRWSPLNITLANRLIDEGRMAEAGLAAFRARTVYEEDFLEKRKQADPPLPDAFREALAANPTAMKHFVDMAPGYRRQYIGWIAGAKREETRLRRVAETIRRLERNQKPGMV